MRLRTVDFHVKLRCFHKNGTYSSSTRFPCFGAGGRISSAGTACSSRKHEKNVAAIVHTRAAAVAAAPKPQSYGSRIFGRY